MKTFEQDFKTNPSFNTVTGLTNTTFDPNNVVSGRGATEDQVKFVHDMIKALQDWLDENGCSDDPYAIIRQKIDEVEAAIDVCCANPQDTLIQMLTNRLNQLETDMNTCCQAMDDNAYQMLVDRLDALEQSIEDCCKGGSASTDTCDGNVITVSYTWNGPNPLADGGTATATSSISGRSIVSYHFLVSEGGVKVKSSHGSGVGPDWGWTIDSSGNMTATSGTWSGKYAIAIIATDDHGCEGITPITLPGGAVGG